MAQQQKTKPAPWMTQGPAGAEKARKLNEERKKQAENQKPFRWFMKADLDGKALPLIFLDSAGVWIREHAYQDERGYWNKFRTCTVEYADCPDCANGDRSYYVCFRTVIDPTPYTIQSGDRKGETVSYNKRLHAVKMMAAPRWDAFIRDHGNGDLTLAVVEITRMNEKEGSSGLPSKIRGRITREQLAKKMPKGEKSVEEWLKPYDYVSIFQPDEVVDAKPGNTVGSADAKFDDTPPDGLQDLDELFSD